MSDTIAAIAGSIAEGYYGVPDALKIQCRSRLPQPFLTVLDRFDNR